MQAIYEPKGRALEYSLLALNPWGYSWCSHDCTYCYVPGMCRKTHEQWREVPFKPRKNILKLVRKDAEELAGTNKRVMLCFAGDLYSPEAVATGIGRQILGIFREFNVPFQVLTKGGTFAVEDFDLYGPNDAFATTLTFSQGNTEWLKYEPGATGPSNRMRAIARAKQKGIQTWVSLEPVLDPQQSLWIIQATQEIVDLYKIGKLNHDPKREAEIDWRKFAWDAMTLCNKYRKPFIFKDDLLKYCDFEIVGQCKTDPRLVARGGA